MSVYSSMLSNFKIPCLFLRHLQGRKRAKRPGRLPEVRRRESRRNVLKDSGAQRAVQERPGCVLPKHLHFA